MDDWFWAGLYGRRHSQVDGDAFYRALVRDQPGASCFSNARRFVEHYAALRERALERPTAAGDTLVPKPAVWPAPEGHFTNFVRLPRARLPADIVPGARRLRCSLPSNPRFTIVEPLQVGLDRLAQTFTASVGSSASWDGHLVVVKIYQDSLAENDWLRGSTSPGYLQELESEGAPEDWKPLWHSAANEAAAYEHLEVLQGSVLPWYHGVFDVSALWLPASRAQPVARFDLPSGESAYGLVIERLHAPTLYDIASGMRDPSVDRGLLWTTRYKDLVGSPIQCSSTA
jgi:hypothetical protein